MRRTSLRGQFLSSRDLDLSWRVVVMKSFLSASIKIETGVEAIADIIIMSSLWIKYSYRANVWNIAPLSNA